MKSIIALAQCGSTENMEENLHIAHKYMKSAKLACASMIVFPEYFMMPYTAPDHQYVTKAQKQNGSFVSRMALLAKEYGLWVIFGMNEKPDLYQCTEKNKCYNTLILLDDRGNRQGYYRKQHLFDAFHWKESDDTLPGETTFTPVKTPFGILGLATCYDLRFPDVARKQALAGAQIMIYPSAWVKGDMKDIHWKTLLQARAIENSMYVIGCSQYTPDTYLGKSCAFDPMGRLLAEGDSREEMLLVSVIPEETEETRKTIPALLSELS